MQASAFPCPSESKAVRPSSARSSYTRTWLVNTALSGDTPRARRPQSAPSGSRNPVARQDALRNRPESARLASRPESALSALLAEGHAGLDSTNKSLDNTLAAAIPADVLEHVQRIFTTAAGGLPARSVESGVAANSSPEAMGKVLIERGLKREADAIQCHCHRSAVQRRYTTLSIAASMYAARTRPLRKSLNERLLTQSGYNPTHARLALLVRLLAQDSAIASVLSKSTVQSLIEALRKVQGGGDSHHSLNDFARAVLASMQTGDCASMLPGM